MPDGTENIILNIARSIDDINAEDWDACVANRNPFLKHAFLSALERSGSATAETGWSPHHLWISDYDGKIAACAPLYLKNHSYGEYVFDWAWADAFLRAGGAYYPKLQCCVPFTPVTGPRLMVKPGSPDSLRLALIDGMLQLVQNNDLSGIHITFNQEDEIQPLKRMGFLHRIGLQYHWDNKGYQTFDDFLKDLNSRKRKAIKKERQKVIDAAVTFEILRSADLTENHWDYFYQFHRATIDKKWGPGYLTRDFFSMIGESMAEDIVLIMAKYDNAYVGAALNLLGSETLYGRYWGGAEAFKFLHFECCYYQAIDCAIQLGLKKVEAGAQGSHKIQRGYSPVITHSAHWIAHPGLRRAVDDFVHHEANDIRAEATYLEKHSPFRNESRA